MSPVQSWGSSIYVLEKNVSILCFVYVVYANVHTVLSPCYTTLRTPLAIHFFLTSFDSPLVGRAGSWSPFLYLRSVSVPQTQFKLKLRIFLPQPPGTRISYATPCLVNNFYFFRHRSQACILSFLSARFEPNRYSYMTATLVLWSRTAFSIGTPRFKWASEIQWALTISKGVSWCLRGQAWRADASLLGVQPLTCCVCLWFQPLKLVAQPRHQVTTLKQKLLVSREANAGI